MIIDRYGDTWHFKAGERRKLKFYILFSDLSAFGNPVKDPQNLRKNYRKVMEKLLKYELNELVITLKNSNKADHFEIRNINFYGGRTKEEVEWYRKMDQTTTIKPEPPKLELEIWLPSSSAVKVFAEKDNYKLYLVNKDGNFIWIEDFEEVEKITGAYF